MSDRTPVNSPPKPPNRPTGWRSRISWWWLVPVLLLLLPAVLVLVFLWSTPDVATFDYSIL